MRILHAPTDSGRNLFAGFSSTASRRDERRVCTPAARSASTSYASSCAALSDRVPVGNRPLNLPDLACGDGHLLGLLAARRQPHLQLLGVDMSEAERAAARAALPACVRRLPGSVCAARSSMPRRRCRPVTD